MPKVGWYQLICVKSIISPTDVFMWQAVIILWLRARRLIISFIIKASPLPL